MEAEDIAEPLQLLAHHIVFYPKNLNPDWFANPKTFNFTNDSFTVKSQGVHLVLLSKTFNISKEVGVNNYVLCSANVPTHRFIVRFGRGVSANYFLTFIKDDLNDDIDCPPNLVTHKMVKKIRARIHPSGLPAGHVKSEEEEEV